MIFGRDTELQILNTAYEQMLAGHGSVLFLTGEAGLGKTTLVHTWRDECQGMRDEDNQKKSLIPHPSTLFLESACSIPIGNIDVGRLEALQPWADVIAQLNTSSDGSDPSDKKKINLKKLIHDAAPAWAWALPLVGDIAHAALETTRLVKEQRGDFEIPTTAQNQQQVFQQYVNLLTKISADMPLIIFLDDLHWADTSSCNLLFYLSRQITDKKILVIATYRPDDAVQANEGKGHAIIEIKNEIVRYETGRELPLDFLNISAIRALLAERFSGYVSDDKFERWLRNISDGNALFVTQFLKTLTEDRLLTPQGQFIGEYGSVAIPRTALAVVEQRTRRLDDDTRHLLCYATAEGEEFTSYILSQLTEKKPMQLIGELKKAQRVGMITDRGTSRAFANQTTAVFGFSHALFHKALYDQLMGYEQEMLHRQCFEILTLEWNRLADSSNRSTTLATKLLTHAEKCEQWVTVAEVALEAARECWRTFNEAESLEMIERVNAACNKAAGMTGPQAEALMLRASINILRGRNDDAYRDFETSQKLFRTAGLVVRAVDAAIGAAGTHNQSSSFERAIAESQLALAEAQAIGHREGEANALRIIGNAFQGRGDPNEALKHHTKSFEISAACGNLMGEAAGQINIGIVQLKRGAYDEAQQSFQRSLDIAHSLGNRRLESNSLTNLGSARWHCDARDEAVALWERALVICIATGDRQNEGILLANIGNACVERGELAEALVRYEKSLAIFVDIRDKLDQARTLLAIGAVYQRQSEMDTSLSYFRQSDAMARDVGDRIGEIEALCHIGELHALTRAFAESRAALDRALQIALDLGIELQVGMIHGRLGSLAEMEAEAASGDARRRLLTNAIRHFEQCIINNAVSRNEELMVYENNLLRVRALLTTA